MRPEGFEGVGAVTTRGKESRAAILERAIRLKRSTAGPRHATIGPRPSDQPARLGEMQRSLWLLHQLEPNSAAYNLASAFRVSGKVSGSALERSLNEVGARHRLLRSSFKTDRKGVLQQVHPALALEVERFAAAPGKTTEVAAAEAGRPFDLATPPLVRCLLVEEPRGGDSLLVLVMHHILADERSLEVLWRELVQGYEADAEFTSSVEADTEDDLAPQYDDYVHWLAGRRSSERADVLAYWKRRLDPLPEDLALPFERAVAPSPGASSGPTGRLLRRTLDPETHQRVERLASEARTTPFAVLAFAFKLLLQRYSQPGRTAFGTPASTRAHPATAGMVGYFLNPIAVDSAVDEESTVRQSLGAFAADLRECLAQASLPFDVLVEELAPPRRRRRHPIFQAMFVYQEASSAPVLAGIPLEPVTLDLGEPKFDLTLFVSASADSHEIAVEYRTERFDDFWMERLLGHYATLVASLEANVERPAAEVPMLGPDEARELRLFEQGGELGANATRPLPVRIVERARTAPASPAVVSSGEDWSYAELERVGRRVARELVRAGARPGDRVGLFLPRSAWMIGGILGSHLAGAAYVPLDPTYPAARNREVLEDAEVEVVLTASALSGLVPETSAAVLEIDARDSASEDFRETSALEALSGELPAYLLYTSGSTGRPKGVVVTHENLAVSTAARSEVYRQSPGRFLLLPSVAFDSSVAGIFWTLAEGGTLVVPTEDQAKDPRQLARLIAERRVTSLLSVPSLYAHLLEAGAEQLAGLETVIVAGESCPAQLVEEHFAALPAARLYNEYGPTEATVWATVHEIEPADARGVVPLGRPIPGVRIEVRDPHGRRLPAGVPGEGWVFGPTVASGYWRRSELTDERFVSEETKHSRRDRGYRTGDRLSWDQDGRLLFHGRLDEQIKLRGFRIEPGEVEAVLLDLVEVEEAAVGVRDAEALVAYLVTREPFETRALREQLLRRLPEHMVPGRFVEVAELPRLPNGKLDRGALPEIPLATAVEDEARAPILDDRHHFLVSLWEGLLGRAGIGLGDNFFQLGGHSLAVVEMTAAIERDLGVALAPADVFQNPTIAELAQRIEREGGGSAASYTHLFPVEPGGRQSPFIFCIPHFFSGMLASRFRGERPVYGLRGVGLRPEGNRGRWRTMQDLGHDLAEEVVRRFPNEKFIIAGYSFGGTMAVELVRQLEARGVEVQTLYLIAPMALDHYSFGPFRVQLDGLRQPVDSLSPGQAFGRFLRDSNPLRRRPYGRFWRLIAVEPWRRFLCAIGRVRRLAGASLTPRILYADVRLERFRLHRRYRAGVVRSPTVVFNATEPETDAAATWRPHFEGPFTVRDIPDPHLDEDSIEGAKKVILEQFEELAEA